MVIGSMRSFVILVEKRSIEIILQFYRRGAELRAEGPAKELIECSSVEPLHEAVGL